MVFHNSVRCGAQALDSGVAREIPVERKVDMKCIQVNALKNIARTTGRLYVLIMSHKRFRVNLHSVVA